MENISLNLSLTKEELIHLIDVLENNFTTINHNVEFVIVWRYYESTK